MPFIGLLSKKGAKMDVFHEHVEDSFGIENAGPMDMKNVIIETMLPWPSRAKMLAKLERRHQISQETQPTDEDMAKDFNP